MHFPITEQICKPTISKNRRYSGFNVLEKETTDLFNILCNADYVINGFRNKDIRDNLYPYLSESEYEKVRNKVTRLLGKLQHQGLIKKVQKSLKYYVSSKGRRVMSSILYFKNKEYPEEIKKVS